MRFLQYFVPTVIDIPFIILAIFFAHTIIDVVVKRHKIKSEKRLLIKLYYYHLMFCFVYLLYIMIFGGDAIGYWKPPTRFIPEGASMWLLHAPGSSYIHFITYPFSQVLGLSLWGGTAVFSLFGFAGIICIYLTIKKTLKVNPVLFGFKLFPLILFLPNMHFWSGGIGKDTIIFFALAMFIYSLTDIKRNIPGLVISFYLAFYVRPHIALVMLVGAGMAMVLSSRGISSFWRIAMIAVSIVVFVLISSTVFTFIGVDEDSIETYEDVANIRSKNLSRRSVGSAISISSYPVPFKMFTFLYRPLFVDSGNLFGLVVSFENLFYLILTLSILRWKHLMEMFSMPMVYKACFFISGATTYFMSSSLSNLGIIIRQKNMVMFMIVIMSLYILSQVQYKEYQSVLRLKLHSRRLRQVRPVSQRIDPA